MHFIHISTCAFSVFPQYLFEIKTTSILILLSKTHTCICLSWLATFCLMKQFLLNTLGLHRSSSTYIKMLLFVFPLLTFSWFPVVHLIHFPFLGLLHFLLFTLCMIPYWWFHRISHWWLWYPIFRLLSLSDLPLLHYYLIATFWPHFPYW